MGKEIESMICLYIIYRLCTHTDTECPINFEIQNYTIITSQCKPKYKSEDCCPAFEQFACPFREDLNDLRNDCATTMFNYIYLNKIPRGLLNSLCGQVNDGVTCPASPPLQSETAAAADASTTARPAASLVFALLTVITFLFINFY